MRLRIDLDIALFSVQHKLDKECRAYYFFRELAKGTSGYINRRKAISAYMENADVSYGTANRRINSLLELGWMFRAGKGNVHVTGLYRVKTLLANLQKEGNQFVWRRRTAEIDLFPVGGKNSLDSFKGSLTAALTSDKLNRNRHKAKAGLRSSRKSKADIGTALAKNPYLNCYSHSLKCADWSLSAGTVNRRKKASELLNLESYHTKMVEGFSFTSKAEAIEAAIALEYTGKYFKRVFYRMGFYGLRDADEIWTNVELFRRGKPNHLKAKELTIHVSGNAAILKNIKDLTKKQRSSSLFIQSGFDKNQLNQSISFSI